MTDVNEVAQALKQAFLDGAYHEALIPHFANSIVVHHHPTAGPGDGPVDGSVLAMMMRGDPFAPVVSNVRREAEAITIDGNAVTAVMMMIGTAEDGSEIRIPLTQTFGFAEGRIVTLDHYTDPTITDPIMKAVHAARSAATTST